MQGGIFVKNVGSEEGEQSFDKDGLAVDPGALDAPCWRLADIWGVLVPVLQAGLVDGLSGTGHEEAKVGGGTDLDYAGMGAEMKSPSGVGTEQGSQALCGDSPMEPLRIGQWQGMLDAGYPTPRLHEGTSGLEFGWTGRMV